MQRMKNAFGGNGSQGAGNSMPNIQEDEVDPSKVALEVAEEDS
jgi:hypothetical protein